MRHSASVQTNSNGRAGICSTFPDLGQRNLLPQLQQEGLRYIHVNSQEVPVVSCENTYICPLAVYLIHRYRFAFHFHGIFAATGF